MKHSVTILGLAIGMAGALALPTAASAATPEATTPSDTTVRVTGDTVDATGADGPRGWAFNRDSKAAFTFSADEQSIGDGSLYVKPIIAGTGQKFVAENFVQQVITEETEISFDFVAGPKTDASQFYLNVYATTANDGKFYDCRFDYVATGSASDWTTLSTTATPTNVARSSSARIPTCPTTLAGMPAGSGVRAFAINVGQSTDSDVGVSGYLDNATLTTAAGTTTYDFEVFGKDDCKNGGWKTTSHRNQGACVSSFQASSKAGK